MEEVMCNLTARWTQDLFTIYQQMITWISYAPSVITKPKSNCSQTIRTLVLVNRLTP
ncbi:subtilisin-like protease sbt5.4 [Phtheirospermum japonicum]|uniref:Subtilisin-like protease sbt5.4 n=1 Tax=Phtheirospermum japonicum TaxID=374723 RepID=A0A830D3L1_9LAMI|nr:subtilisin-like protease sbt5.4 [Phtheirospermum japonicum]